MANANVQGNLNKLYAFHAIRGAMFTMPIITLFFQENGLSMQDIFVLQAIFSITAILFEIPSGYLLYSYFILSERCSNLYCEIMYIV